jgi:H+/Cl- antiporter ClcA
MIRAWLLEHLIENSRGLGRGASGFLAVCSGDEGVLLVLLLPQPAFLLLLGVVGGGVLGGIFLPLALGIGEDGSDRLLARGEVGGDI